MSYSIYPHCSTRTDVFAHGSGEQDIVNLENLLDGISLVE